ncbi:LOW QUALITY PROTEIN: hypothetical protein KUTeg_010851 [Tegillarca granosa]|uniref:UDP-N-acetylglucosamine transferase subunit ALG13 n=1 Tax=Tegillarca granosa TaxID=220873 RepID=A0ABQ9F270_TEGGR|nr:LOW QUALITY PROTEIN: hypothetical protein KUTeg_010851 [Tegillarca granosa]
MNEKSVFVTVGTTQFDKLIRTVTSPEICKKLKSRGYEKLILQIGKGEVVPSSSKINGLTIEHYRYKTSIIEDIQNASLVISHAALFPKPSGGQIPFTVFLVVTHHSVPFRRAFHGGAGSCLETLGAGKPLLVVINEDLMDNHQLELAYKLFKDQHIYYCNCRSYFRLFDWLIHFGNERSVNKLPDRT